MLRQVLAEARARLDEASRATALAAHRTEQGVVDLRARGWRIEAETSASSNEAQSHGVRR